MKEEKPVMVESGEDQKPIAESNESNFSKIHIVRAFSHKGNLASEGHTFYKYSYQFKTQKCHPGTFNRIVEKWQGAVQIALAYEESVGTDAVKDYIRRKYIFKSK